MTNKKILLDATVDYLTEVQIQNNSVDTCIGLFEKRWYSESNYHILVNGDVCYDVLVADDEWVNMRTVVIDNRTLQLVESLYYMHIVDENIEWNTILCRVE